MIKLYTDTSANLTMEIIQRYGIEVVPFSYCVVGSDENIPAQIEFDGREFYDKMRGGMRFKTSMIGVGTYIERFEQSLLNGDDIIYIAMSSGISGSAGSALVAKRELEARFENAKIAVIDTYAASLGEGMLAIEAAKLIERGDEFDDIVRQVLELRDHMSQFFTVENLEYLKSGGRISGIAAVLGAVLNIKPVLRGDESGKIVLCSKTKGMRRALDEMAKKYDALVLDKSAYIGIAHADNDAGVSSLLNMLAEKGFTGNCLTVVYEQVTGSHVGPGSIALFFFGKHK